MSAKSIWVILVSLAASGCAVTGTTGNGLAPISVTGASAAGKHLNFDFSGVYFSDTLDELEVDFDSDSPIADFDILELERRRFGPRFAFGTPQAGGFFTVFIEDWDDSPVFPDMTTYGIGGGGRGMPRIQERGDLAFIIPYTVQFALIAGEDDVTEDAIGLVEVLTEVGFGIDFHGLRPHFGITVSSIGGAYEVDIPDETGVVTGINGGFYGEIQYSPEQAPVYMRLRAFGGDREGVEFAFGAAW